MAVVSKRPVGRRLLCLPLSLAVVAITSCSDSVEPDEALSGTLIPGKVAVFLGDSVTVEAVVEYRSGPRIPDTVAWSVSDDSVLGVASDEPGKATVRGLARGTAYVIALIDGVFWDSTEVSVGGIGDIRWRLEGAGSATVSGPALDGAGLIYTSRFVHAAPGTLNAVTPEGQLAFSVPGCWADLSVSVLPDGTAYTTRSVCLRRHAPGGVVEWQVSCSSSYSGIAVARDGSALCVDEISKEHRGRVLVRFSADGAEQWRTSLGGAGIMEWRAAPAIAANGDVYVAWQSVSPTGGWLSRVSSGGALLWTVPLGGIVELTTPAPLADGVILSYWGGGVAVYDTAGSLLWERDWYGGGDVSSPVVDAGGNIFIQSYRTLISYDAGGTLRWAADSLSSYQAWGSPAPALLSDGQLVVPCKVVGEARDEVCAVNGADGSLVWRSDTGLSMYGSVAVARDGTIYVSTVADDLLALWGRTPPLTAGWPTEGGSMHRLRRR